MQRLMNPCMTTCPAIVPTDELDRQAGSEQSYAEKDRRGVALKHLELLEGEVYVADVQTALVKEG